MKLASDRAPISIEIAMFACALLFSDDAASHLIRGNRHTVQGIFARRANDDRRVAA